MMENLMILFFANCFGSVVNTQKTTEALHTLQKERATKLLHTLQNMDIKREAMIAFQNFGTEAKKANDRLNAMKPEPRITANINMEKIDAAQPILETEIRSVLSDFKELRYEGYRGDPSLEEIGILLDKVGETIPRIYRE